VDQPPLPVDWNMEESYPERVRPATLVTAMIFGERVRELRKGKNLTLRALAGKVGVNSTYLSKNENGKLDFGEYPGERLVLNLAQVFGEKEEDLMLLAEK